MQYYYGGQNILRALDEAEFWKHQETEHTTVIRAVTPDLEAAHVQALKEFERELSQSHGYLVRFIQSVVRSNGVIDGGLKEQMMACIVYCMRQSADFVRYLEKMLSESKAVQNNTIAQTVIHHIIRESQYFIGIEKIASME